MTRLPALIARSVLYFRTWKGVARAMFQQDMRRFLPLLGLLMLLSLVIYFVNFTATLAPFVYSFF